MMDAHNLAHHAAGIRALARQLAHDAARADDVVQEACLAALRRPPNSRAPLRPWLVRVVRNLAARDHRSESRRRRREQAVARKEGTTSTSEAVARAELYERLMAHVLDLDEPYRETLLLRYFEGLAVREVARRMDVPAGTAAARIHRGLAQLRGRLDAESTRPGAWAPLLLPLAALPGTAKTMWIGAFAMSAKKITVIAVALVLALTWWVTRDSATPTKSERAGRAADRVDAHDNSEQRLGGEAPLAAIDLDLDVHGVVTNAAGHAVPGAIVKTSWHPWQLAGIWFGHRFPESKSGPEAVADPKGRFRIRLRRGQQVHLTASAAGHRSRTVCDVLAGQKVAIVLGGAVSTRIRLIDLKGRAIAGCSVRLSRIDRYASERNFIERRGTTDGMGWVLFAGLPPGAWGSLDAGLRNADNYPVQNIAFPQEGTAEYTVRLRRGRTITGVVRDPTGAPIAGARVGASWTMRHHVLTNARGEFALPHWSGGWKIHASAQGYSRANAIVGLRQVLELTLARASRARGRILDAAHQPVAGALLVVQGRGGSEIKALEDTTTDATGAFTFQSLAAGLGHTLTITAPGHGRTVLDFDAAPAGERRDLGDLVLPRPLRIEGRFETEVGAPIADAYVALTGHNTDRARMRPDAPPLDRGTYMLGCRTDHAGRFRFPDLAPGKYVVTAYSLGSKDAVRDVELQNDENSIRLVRVGSRTIRVTVVDTHREPVFGISVSLELKDQWSISTPTDVRGVVEFVVDQEPHRVRLFDMQTRYVIPPPRDVALGETDLTLVVEPCGRVRGIVLDLNGKPLAQAAMRVLHNGTPYSQGPSSAFSDTDGRFSLLTPQNGRVDIILTGTVNRIEGVNTSDPTPFGGTLRNVPDGAEGLILQARPIRNERTLKAVVLDPDGQPVSGAQVFVQHLGKLVPGANVLTDKRGRANLTALPNADVVVYGKGLPSRHPGADRWLRAQAWPVLPNGQEVTLRIVRAAIVGGQVVNAKREPIGALFASLYEDAQFLRGTICDKDGKFEFRVRADRKFPLRVVIQKPGVTGFAESKAMPDKLLVIEFPPPE